MARWKRGGRNRWKRARGARAYFYAVREDELSRMQSSFNMSAAGAGAVLAGADRDVEDDGNEALDNAQPADEIDDGEDAEGEDEKQQGEVGA